MSDETLRNFGELRQGDPFELIFTNVIDPVAGTAITDWSGIQLEFSVKASLDDLDAAALANFKEDDSARVSDTAGQLDVMFMTNADSAALTPGEIYYFDGKFKDSNGVWRSFDLAADDDSDEITVGYFWVSRSVTRTPAD